MGCENDFIQCDNKELTWEDLVRLGVGLTTGGKPAMRVMGLASGPPPCVDTPVDFFGGTGDMVSGNYINLLPAPAPGDWYNNPAPILSGSALFGGAQYRVRRGVADDGGGVSAVMGYWVYDGVSTFSPNIDSTIDNVISIDLIEVVARSGKNIILTLVDNANDKYIQMDLSSKPYGTFSQTIAPGDWSSGVAGGPGFGGFYIAEQAINFFVFVDNTTAGGADDDYDIDNVLLTHIECI